MPALLHPASELAKALRAAFHPALAQLDLERCPAPVGRFDDSVDLQPFLLPVVVHLRVRRLGIDAQIADDHGLEQKAKELEVGSQAGRRGAQRRNRQRRIDEVPDRHCPQDRPGAQVRRPCRLVFHHHEPFQGVEILGNRVGLQGATVVSNLGRQLRHGYGGGDVARERSQKTPDLDGVAGLSAYRRYVGAADFVEIGAIRAQDARQRVSDIARPPAGAYKLRNGRDREVGPFRPLFRAIHEPAQRDLPGGASELVKRQRTHAQPGETTGAGMAGDVVGGHGGTGEDELAGHGPPIDRPAHMIPDGRLKLPLVNQSRRVSIQYRRRVHADRPPGIFVNVQQHLALCRLHGSGCLPRRLGPLHKDRAGGAQQLDQLGIDNPWQVPHFPHPTMQGSRRGQ